MKLLLATTNPGKVREFEDLLAGCGLELLTPEVLKAKADVREAGGSYAENARIKARALAAASGLVTLADDSGLEVDALHGAPGLHSARYAGAGATDADRVRLLLANLKGVPFEKRTARFRCVIAIAEPGGAVRYAEGSCEGLIALEPRGANGFGYDPVFHFPEYGKTMAELPGELKNRISHRARATAAARPVLVELTKGQSHARSA